MRSSRNALTPVVTGALLAALTGGCNLKGANTTSAALPGDPAVHHAMLDSIARNAVGPAFQDAATATATLRDATASYRDALAQGDAPAEAQLDARAAWTAAATAWQVVEQMQLGPAAPSASAVGGADKRDEIYSWPSVNPCRIDQEIVEQEYLQADFYSAHLVNSYGLDALEYLLFHAEQANACAPQLPLNADGTWDALGSDEVQARRAAYAAAIAAGVANEAAALASAWAPSGGTFTEHLANPDQGGSPYGTVRGALDDVVRAMFYLDLLVKDEKLAVPAGLLDCTTAPCLTELEFVHAQVSKEAVLANLDGFQRLFHGGTDPATHTGFDDWLVSLGETQLAAQMTASIATAVETCGAVEGSFTQALTADSTALHACHTQVREITDWLKGDFSTLLLLTVPNEAAGDAD